MKQLDKKFAKLKEVAEILGVDSRTAKKIIQNADGLHYTRLSSKNNGRILVNIEELMKYMQEHTIIRY
jgi:predicted site-specific integrase-resolvase